MKLPVPGMATALALTPSGGVAAEAECMLLSGSGKLLVTGNLLREARDSCQVALSLARSRARRFKIPPADFLRTDAHFHVPGQASKDGASAGLALFMAAVSAMIRKPLDPDTAFVGEISLSGKLHDAGGLPGKIRAAQKAGVKRIFVPENSRGKKNMPGVELIPAGHVDAVLAAVFPQSGFRK